MNKVFLDISCWAGISLGAEHYYATLTINDHPNYSQHRLNKVLTEKDAAALNKKDKCAIALYEAGELSDRFDSESEVIKLAMATWKKIFPSGEILLLGSSAVGDPAPILIAPEPIFTKGNELYQRARKIGFWDYHEDQMMVIAKEWDILFKEERT